MKQRSPVLISNFFCTFVLGAYLELGSSVLGTLIRQLKSK